jgi:polyphosphate kinase 2 (PPK2 family)
MKLESLDMKKKLKKDEYRSTLKALQLDIVGLQRDLVDRRIPVVIAFEGMDAAGKGGAIKRLTARLDPRGYEVHAIGPPDVQEANHHWLRRFWLRLPGYGRIGVFDRSWYGRVLVERIEKLTPPESWELAYDEIDDFERTVVADETVLLKFWMHLTSDEQLRRFEARQNDAYKRWKITDDDWRNRQKWDQYIEAAEEMIERTSTDSAPWIVVEGDDKYYARVKVLREVTAALRTAVETDGFGHPAPDDCAPNDTGGMRSSLGR